MLHHNATSGRRQASITKLALRIETAENTKLNEKPRKGVMHSKSLTAFLPSVRTKFFITSCLRDCLMLMLASGINAI